MATSISDKLFPTEMTKEDEGDWMQDDQSTESIEDEFEEYDQQSKDGSAWKSQFPSSQVAIRPDLHAATPQLSSLKPRFLSELEEFLGNELDSLGVTAVKPNETRLQAHREAFEYFIEDFKSYKPILAAIKNEYEMMLNHQNTYIKQLEPLRQMLVTVTEECDKQIMKLRDDEKNAIRQVKADNEGLQSVIDGIKNDQFALQTQVDRLKQKISDQYDRYRAEADTRKLLVSDINDLRAQQEDLLYQQQQASKKDKSEDPVAIRQALKESRGNEQQASRQITDIIANYGDVIPKDDYLQLQQQFKELEAANTKKISEFDSLKEGHESLMETHKQAIQQRDEHYQESERLRQTATPRPDWPACAEIISGGKTRWAELSNGKNSDDMVGILLSELAGTAGDLSTVEQFDGQGPGESVPAHLRFEGVVKNRNTSRRDISLLVKEVWKEKYLADIQTLPQRSSLSEFFIKYLKSRFTNEKMAYEWSYNTHYACLKYQHDEKIRLFYGILNEEIDQELYFTQLHYLSVLLSLLQNGVSSQEEFRNILAGLFVKPRTEEELDLLVQAAQLELEDTEISEDHQRLLCEALGPDSKDDEGKFGPFVDELNKQHEQVRSDYINGIIANLSQTSETVRPAELESAIYENDKDLESSVIELLLLFAYKVSGRSELESAEPVTREFIHSSFTTRYIKNFCQS